jgi:hypothetical protein
MKSNSFKGKVAFVTGAASGIGRATAIAFALEGAGVLGCPVLINSLIILVLKRLFPTGYAHNFIAKADKTRILNSILHCCFSYRSLYKRMVLGIPSGRLPRRPYVCAHHSLTEEEVIQVILHSVNCWWLIKTETVCAAAR